MEPEIKLFVGGLSHDTNEQTLRDYFSEYGEIKSYEILRDRITGLGRGFGFILFVDSSVVEHVLSDEHVILGKKVEVKVAKPKGSKEPVLETQSVKKIFVGGIPPDSTKEELEKHFEKYGTVEHVEVRHPRGFGFVTFESEEGAKSALRTRFQHLKNKRVEVKVAEVKAKVDLNAMRSSLTCGNYGDGNMTFPSFPTTDYAYGNPYVPYYEGASNWYTYYGNDAFCYNSYFPDYYNGGNWQHINNPPVVTRSLPASSKPVIRPPPASNKPVIRPPPASNKPVIRSPPASSEPVIRPTPASSQPVVVQPPPAKEEQNGNVVDLAKEIDEKQDEIDGESVTNGEVQTQDEINGEILTKVAVSAGDSF